MKKIKFVIQDGGDIKFDKDTSMVITNLDEFLNAHKTKAQKPSERVVHKIEYKITSHGKEYVGKVTFDSVRCFPSNNVERGCPFVIDSVTLNLEEKKPYMTFYIKQKS